MNEQASSNLLRDALEHIIKTVGQSRTQTRRLRWIGKRAELALAGRQYVAAEHELPPSGETEHGKLLVRNGRLRIERDALQERLNVADQRVDDLQQRTSSIVGKITQCKACGSDALFWFAHNKNHSVVQNNRLNTNDVTCLLVLGCSDCSETLMTVSADKLAERMTAALNPTAEAESHDE